MEACSVARIMSSWSPSRNLCSILFRVLPKLIGLSPSLPKELCEYQHVNLPLLEPTVGTLPDLPHDILMDIFATLEMPDLVRAGSVCTSWRSVYTTLRKLGKYKQSQTPCLLYTCESAGESVACIYSLVEKKSYTLTLPDPPICRRYVIGSSLGWLVTVDERPEMHLVNPVTGEQTALPSVTTIEHVKPIYDGSGSVLEYEYSDHTADRVYNSPTIYPPTILRDFLYIKAFVFFEKSTGSYIVVLIHNPELQLSFARVGDDKWTWMPPRAYYKDCTYKDGILYAVTSAGSVHAFDISGPVVTLKIIIELDYLDIDCDDIYIVLAPWGDLLQVRRSREWLEDSDRNPETVLTNTSGIKIYKVGTELVEINFLHDHVLFLGHNQSLCLSAKEHLHLKANHVYFTDDQDYLYGAKNNRRDIGVFDMAKNNKEELVSPHLWSNWPTPTWITPSLRKMEILNEEI
ncbi:unnamed protein product [Alopecurus aequalis]